MLYKSYHCTKYGCYNEILLSPLPVHAVLYFIFLLIINNWVFLWFAVIFYVNLCLIIICIQVDKYSDTEEHEYLKLVNNICMLFWLDVPFVTVPKSKICLLQFSNWKVEQSSYLPLSVLIISLNFLCTMYIFTDILPCYSHWRVNFFNPYIFW